jgi:hypothetical protein
MTGNAATEGSVLTVEDDVETGGDGFEAETAFRVDEAAVCDVAAVSGLYWCLGSSIMTYTLRSVWSGCTRRRSGLKRALLVRGEKYLWIGMLCSSGSWDIVGFDVVNNLWMGLYVCG